MPFLCDLHVLTVSAQSRADRFLSLQISDGVETEFHISERDR